MSAFGAALAARMRTEVGRQFDQAATVYTRAAGGAFTTTATSSLACLLQPDEAGGDTGPSRAEIGETATLWWAPTYTMPEPARVEVDAFPGVRWHVEAGTAKADVGPGSVVVARHATIRRVR